MYIKTEIKDKVAEITFFHPSHNSLPSNLLADFTQAINDASANDEVLLILIKSEGEKTFCAGASFDELASIQDFETGHRFFMGFANVINAIRKSNKLVIGRVHGKAIGGGVGIAAAVDYCMASQYASIKLSELAVGIGPFVIGPAVERKMGLSAFSQMAINATEWQTAKWGKERGLFHEVFDTVEQLDAYIDHFINILKGSNPDAIAELKRVCWEGTEHWDTLLSDRAAISGRLVLSDFTKNAIAGFKGKG